MQYINEEVKWPAAHTPGAPGSGMGTLTLGCIMLIGFNTAITPADPGGVDLGWNRDKCRVVKV